MSRTLNDDLADQRRRVDFDTYDISVQQLISMLDKYQIDIAPEYQRHFRWNAKQQSQLIESVFLGIPVPPLFMATNKDGTWEVVDGVQRLSTLVHYAADSQLRRRLGLDPALLIEGLDKLPSLDGLSFSDLPQSAALQFMLRPIKVVTLSDKSDLVVRFDLFERLNTGGVLLSDQEIRACVFRGSFNDLLQALAQSAEFSTVVNLPGRKKHDRSDEELVLRFFAFRDKYREFNHSVVEFLNEYMKTKIKSSNYKSDADLFKEVFTQLAHIFPDGIQRGNRKNTPVNLYEGITVGAALAQMQNGVLLVPPSMDWIDSEELKGFTTGATNSSTMVKGRIEYCARQFGWTG
ncbi:MAG TPA: DUF262 domain-containing protein [Rubricoccaceae bacterium]|jgi:hypothetical protein